MALVPRSMLPLGATCHVHRRGDAIIVGVFPHGAGPKRFLPEYRVDFTNGAKGELVAADQCKMTCKAAPYFHRGARDPDDFFDEGGDGRMNNDP